MTDENEFFLNPEEGNSEERARLQTAAVAFAKNYLVFLYDERAKALLAHWTATLARRRTFVNAPHTEYAANEALRAFVEDINDQITVAQTAKE